MGGIALGRPLRPAVGGLTNPTVATVAVAVVEVDVDVADAVERDLVPGSPKFQHSAAGSAPNQHAPSSDQPSAEHTLLISAVVLMEAGATAAAGGRGVQNDVEVDVRLEEKLSGPPNCVGEVYA